MTVLAGILPLLKGVGIGAAVAAPVGPMSLLCMRRTLTLGWHFGLSTGVGIAAGDAVYALVAAFGLVAVTQFMLANERPLHLAAGLFLVFLAWRTFLPRPPSAPAAPARTSVLRMFGSAFLLTLTNPPTIISFMAIFTVLAPSRGFEPASALTTVVGVFLGSLAWWSLITAVVSAARAAVGSSVRGWIDRVSAAILGILGIAEIRRSI